MRVDQISDIITQKQKKLISTNDLIHAISAQKTKTEKLVTEKSKQAVDALVMLQVLFYLKDGIGKTNYDPLLTTTISELNEEVRLVAQMLYVDYMDILPMQEYWLKNYTDDEFLLMQSAIDGDVPSSLALSEKFEALGNIDAATYWAEVAYTGLSPFKENASPIVRTPEKQSPTRYNDLPNPKKQPSKGNIILKSYGLTDDTFTVEYKHIVSSRFKRGLLLFGFVSMMMVIVFFVANARRQK